MKPKKLIGRLSDVVEDSPFPHDEDYECRTSAGIRIRTCTLKDYEGCKNYKGSKKIPICYDCPYRGNVGGGR